MNEKIVRQIDVDGGKVCLSKITRTDRYTYVYIEVWMIG
jgi:hypothetical protein